MVHTRQDKGHRNPRTGPAFRTEEKNTETLEIWQGCCSNPKMEPALTLPCRLFCGPALWRICFLTARLKKREAQSSNGPGCSKSTARQAPLTAACPSWTHSETNKGFWIDLHVQECGELQSQDSHLQGWPTVLSLGDLVWKLPFLIGRPSLSAFRLFGHCNSLA